MNEFFAVVDEGDNVIGKATRKECHSNRNLIHRSVYVFVVNNNKVFLQKRSMSKDLYPGFFTASATGHVDYGEDYDEAAKRELKEELGIDAPLLRLGKVKSFTENEREISMLYVCRFGGRIRFNQREIVDGGFFSIDEIEKSLRKGEKKFADGFRIAFTEFLKLTQMHK
ncbi:NUDIX domain-containing protein [Candidatus Bathyarchaeota archaeon]|nr:NUDIX domain-containing protein [Candidatus Bathyarchaeota archaeon]